jgi:hypothetical protein
LAFRIEVFPPSLTKNRDCFLAIERSALPQEKRPRILAWAAGCKAIEALATKAFLDSVRPDDTRITLPGIGASTGELPQSVLDASRMSRAWLATKCHTCGEVTSIPDRELSNIDQWSRIVDTRVLLKCPSGHSFDDARENLLVLVKRLPIRLGSPLP